jgi:hypothetical protein
MSDVRIWVLFFCLRYTYMSSCKILIVFFKPNRSILIFSWQTVFRHPPGQQFVWNNMHMIRFDRIRVTSHPS